MDDTPWLDEDQERAWRALQFMSMRLDAELARQLAVDSDLSYQDYQVLVALTDRPDGRMRIYELAHELGWEKSRLSHHLTRMADRNLVTKEQCDEDRRGAWVVVTPEGTDAIAAAAPGHVRAVRELFVDHLTDDELDVIRSVSETVLAALDERDGLQSS